MQQDVAQHSFRVALIAMVLADMDKSSVNFDKLLRKALLHDIPESILGDIPAPVKKSLGKTIKTVERKSLSSIIKLMENNSLETFYYQLVNECKLGLEGEYIALADMLDRMFYLLTEYRSGNTLLDKVLINTKHELRSKKYKDLFKKHPAARELLEGFNEL